MRQTHVVRLDALQLAWLQELGVEAALLRPYAPSRPHSSIPPPPSRPAPLPNAPQGGQQVRATIRHPVAAPTSKQPQPQPHVPPHRTPHLACQVYAARTDAMPHAPRADWLIVSETPAVGDAHTLIPGRAAQLLDAILAAIGMHPTDAVWRFPAHPATPSPHTAADRTPTQQDQIKDRVSAVRPACILALGRTAATALLHTTQTLQSLRGKVWSYVDATGQSTPVVATYPPGWLLANPQHKVDVWRDLLLARAAQSGIL